MASFPITNPKIEKYSFSVTPDVTISKSASGKIRQRLLTDSEENIFSISITLDDSQLSIFEDFVKNTISNGADIFTGEYYTFSEPQIGNLRIINGEYESSYVTENQWLVSYQFEVINKNYDHEAYG